MNLPSLSKCLRALTSWRKWLLVVVAAALLVAILSRDRDSGSSVVAVDVWVNTNGIATILGVPLGQGPVRDITLRTLSRAKVPVRVCIAGTSGVGWDTNYGQTISAITRAGLIPTNKPPVPSPYE